MAFLALLILLVQNLALGKSYPWALLPYDLGRLLWIVASCGLLVLLLEQADLISLGSRWRRFSDLCVRIAGHRAALVALLLANALFAVVNWSYFRNFHYGFPWAHLVVLGVAVPFLRRDRFWVSCAVSQGLLIASIIHFPLDMGRSDLLLGIQLAWDHLATGISPYAFQYMAHAGEWTMPYLPGTFFAHAPAWLVGLDLRWNQVLWRLAWMMGMGMALARLKADSPWRTVAHVFALNPYYNFRHELYYEAFFAFVVAYHAWPRGRWLSLPVLIWTRQWAWILAPFLVLERLVRAQPPRTGAQSPAVRWHESIHWRPLLRCVGWIVLGIALVSALVALMLYPTTTVDQFIRSAFRFQGMIKFDYGFALGPIAEKLGIPGILQPLQAGLMAALGLLALWRWWKGRFETGAAEGIERLGLVALCVFVLLNPFSEVYMWLEPAFWILAAYTMPDRDAM